MSGRKLKVAVLISGRGSNLQSLIDHFGPVITGSPIEIVLVLSNRPDAFGLERARRAGIPAVVVDHKGFAERAQFDAAMDARIRESGAELVVLAGFLRLLTDGFIALWQDRLVNIHPALLPAFKGLNTHARALQAGVRFHGCTVHFVRPEMDTGPIIAQAAVPVRADDTEETLGRRVLAAEHRLFPLSLRLIAEGKVRVEGERAIIDDAAFAGGVLFNPMGG
ncbi:phosphoribosylglycinamide formyltransferase-1 [Dongia mobilis]|uniref:Phosphoribosylglycinamide formyltransferase n=1 Tax=Dongia mobilis TaxID=578943 RepID=A0A4R6WJ82_9PROT|nr:phosphoribosylglycinamide formyltransferase [Dongia mobilis]TDQ78580.1 phosphoribosylglycinamide formyltransferase-1 [Dongia mobilis]